MNPQAVRGQIPPLVLFDLGGVLVKLRPVRQAFPLDRLLGGATASPERVEEELRAFLRSDVFDRFERGRATREEFFEALRSRFDARVSTGDLEDHYRAILGDPVEDMAELVEDLKRAGARVAGLTDTSPVHLELLQRYPAVRSLEAVVASCVTGFRKPSAEAFRAALARLGVAPEDVYYTDDVPANVDGARAVGLRADLFRGAAAVREALGLANPTRSR